MRIASTPTFAGKVQIYGGNTRLAQHTIARLKNDGIVAEDVSPACDPAHDPTAGNRLMSNNDLKSYQFLQDCFSRLLKREDFEITELLLEISGMISRHRDQGPIFQVPLKTAELPEAVYQQVKTALKN
jgi:hypothetical protein